MNLLYWVNSPEGRSVECPSFNVQGNAAAIAKLAALIANKGMLDGVRLFSAETVRTALSEPKREYDPSLMTMSCFTKGGFGFFPKDLGDTPIASVDLKRSCEDYYGWGGMGGSLFLFDPERNLGVAYVMTKMSFRAIGGHTTDKIMPVVRECLM